jgi:hypothetical protein
MKIILTLLTLSILFAATGCAFRGNRDQQPEHPAGSSGGVDHGEYPGDMDHGDTMQR